MDRETEIIRAIAAEVGQVSPEEILPDTSFRNDLFMYLSDIISLIYYAESEFDVHIGTENAEDIDCVNDILAFIKKSGTLSK